MAADRLQRTRELYRVAICQIVADENHNNRFDYGDIEGLAQSIKVNGLQRPIKVKREGDRFILEDGFRRLRALNLLIQLGEELKPNELGQSTVEVELTRKGYNDDDALFEQIISNDGKPLTALEEGSVYKKLLVKGFSESEIADRTGRNITTVRNNIAMASLPKIVQNMIAENTVSGLTAIKVAQEVDYNEEMLVDVLKTALDKATEDMNDKVDKKLPIKQSKPRVTDRFVDVLNKQNYSKSFKKILALEKMLDDNKIENDEVSLLKKLIAYSKGEIEIHDMLESFMGDGNIDLDMLGEESVKTFEKVLENQTVEIKG